MAPASIYVNTGERLVRLDRHLSEYFLFQTLWVLFKSRFTHAQRRANGAFDTQAIIEAWQHLPVNVVRPERNKRQYLSSVLARNEKMCIRDRASNARSTMAESIMANSSWLPSTADDRRPTIARNRALARPCAASPESRR